MLMEKATPEEAVHIYNDFLSTPAGQKFKNGDFSPDNSTDAFDWNLLKPAAQLIRLDSSKAQDIIDSLPKDEFVHHSLSSPLYASLIAGTEDYSKALDLLKQQCKGTYIDETTLMDILTATTTIYHYPTKLPSPSNKLLPPPPLSALLPFLETFARQGNVAQFESLFHNLTPYFLTKPDDRCWHLRSLAFANAAQRASAAGNIHEATSMAQSANENLTRSLRNGTHISQQTLSEVALPCFALSNRLSDFLRLCQKMEAEVKDMKDLFGQPSMQKNLARVFQEDVGRLWETLDHLTLGTEYTAPNGAVKRRQCLVRINPFLYYDTGKPIPVESRPAIVSSVVQGLCDLDRVDVAEQVLKDAKEYHPNDGVPSQLPALLPKHIPFGSKYHWISAPCSQMFGAIMMAQARKTSLGQKVSDESGSGLPRVMALFEEMQGHGLRPTTSAFNAMAIAFMKAGDYPSACQIYEVMKGAKVQLDQVTKAWLDRLCELGEETDSVKEGRDKLDTVLPDVQTAALFK
jgi:hypothetical protein